MTMKQKIFTIITALIIIIFIGTLIFFNATPKGKYMWNSWMYDVQKSDDDSNYKTLKKVEDTCRSMISSYKSDKLIYEQYKYSDSAEKLGWAEQAKMRANKTAISYNEYILKNEYVWKDNVPDDIYRTLDIIE